MKLYLVRHAVTNWNEQGLMQGESDISINENGIKEANKAKELLKDINFDICISSPLNRAIETANIIVNNRCKVIYDELLLERGLGDFEGEYYKLYKKHNYWDYKENSNYNGVEKVRDLLNRTKIFLDRIKKDYKDKTILIVSHSATIRALHFNIIGYDEKTEFLSFVPKNAEIYEYNL